MTELLYKEEVYAIIGAAMEVYNHLGSGAAQRFSARRRFWR
jgi:hypothetical protein